MGLFKKKQVSGSYRYSNQDYSDGAGHEPYEKQVSRLGAFEYVKKWTGGIQVIFQTQQEAQVFKKALGTQDLMTAASTGNKVDITARRWDQWVLFWNTYKKKHQPTLVEAQHLAVHTYHTVSSRKMKRCVLL